MKVCIPEEIILETSQYTKALRIKKKRQYKMISKVFCIV